MKQNQLVGTEPPGNPLSAEIEQLKRKLELLTGKVDAFEAILRSHLSGEIVEVQV